MNARVKRETAAQDAVDEGGLIVVRKLKKRPIFDGDGKFTGWIRRVVVGRANKDLPHQPEAAAAPGAIDEGIMSAHDQTY
jgi:hypothetical protein